MYDSVAVAEELLRDGAHPNAINKVSYIKGGDEESKIKLSFQIICLLLLPSEYELMFYFGALPLEKISLSLSLSLSLQNVFPSLSNLIRIFLIGGQNTALPRPLTQDT